MLFVLIVQSGGVNPVYFSYNIGGFKFRSATCIGTHKGNILYSAGILYVGSRSQAAEVLEGFSLALGRRVSF